MKRVILCNYFNYCSTIISKFYRGYRVRNELHEYLHTRKLAKQRIMRVIMAYKTRFVLRSIKLQDLLIEIATVKHILGNIRNEEPSEKSERLCKELSGKLPRLQLTFYEEYYLMKRKKWVSHVKVNTYWFEGYIKNLYNPELSVMQGVGKHYDSVDRMSIVDRRIVDVEDYDSRPIKAGGFGNYNLDQYPEYAEERSISKEKKRPDRIRKKQPKYDARKAIEEANQKETSKEKDQKPKKKDKNAFRNFLKSMKEEEKGGSVIKEGDDNLVVIPETKEADKAKQKKQEQIKTKRANRENINLRKKLHEMEKSPPPRVDKKNIKSKIDCWVNDKEQVQIKKVKAGGDYNSNNQVAGNLFEKISSELVTISSHMSKILDNYLRYE
jgi:hypothetical protein